MDEAAVRTLTTGWLNQADMVLRKKFLDAGRIRKFPHGSMIYAFQEEQICLWGVVSGLVRLLVSMNEQEPKLAHCGGPGFWFGDVPVVTGWPRAMQAMAFGETKLCSIDRRAVMQMSREDPDTWRAVGTLCAMNELTAIGAGDDLMIRDSRRRCIAVLLRLSGHRNNFQGASPTSTVPVTQSEFATASNLSRSSASTILSELARRNMIRADYGSIEILDPSALRDFSSMMPGSGAVRDLIE